MLVVLDARIGVDDTRRAKYLLLDPRYEPKLGKDALISVVVSPNTSRHSIFTKS